MQKMVVKVVITCEKCKTCILKTVAKLSGVKSMDLDEEKDTLTVIGDVDSTCIVTALRKKKISAQIVSVGPEKEEKKKEEKKDPCKDVPECCKYNCKMVPYFGPYGPCGTVPYGPYGTACYEETSGCTIV